jgi:hypothetical protein
LIDEGRIAMSFFFSYEYGRHINSAHVTHVTHVQNVEDKRTLSSGKTAYGTKAIFHLSDGTRLDAGKDMETELYSLHYVVVPAFAGFDLLFVARENDDDDGPIVGATAAPVIAWKINPMAEGTTNDGNVVPVISTGAPANEYSLRYPTGRVSQIAPFDFCREFANEEAWLEAMKAADQEKKAVALNGKATPSRLHDDAETVLGREG